MSTPLIEKRKRFSINLAQEHAISQRNYARLLRVFPNWQANDSYSFVVREGSTVLITVSKRDVYSSVFTIQEQGETSLPLLANACTLRVYHDAQMIDILEWNGVKRFKPRYGYPNQAMLARDEKWQLGRFLGEWLDHCLARGRSNKTQTYSSQPV